MPSNDSLNSSTILSHSNEPLKRRTLDCLMAFFTAMAASIRALHCGVGTNVLITVVASDCTDSWNDNRNSLRPRLPDWASLQRRCQSISLLD